MARSSESSPSSKTEAQKLPILLVCGDDEFSVKQTARKTWNSWCTEVGGMDHEVIEGTAGNVDEALRRLDRLREALHTLPFFGGDKLVWFRDCSFLGEDRTASSSSIADSLTSLVDEWKSIRWTGLRLLISAGKPDRRRSFFKTLEKLAQVELFNALAEEKDWADRVESEALRAFRAVGKTITDEALPELISRVGPNLRSLANEVEKLTLHAGGRKEVTLQDVQLLTPLQKLAEGFALGEAVGDRDLVRALKVLDEELWTIRTGADKKKSEIGLVYSLISKVRLLLLVKELRRMGQLKPARDYNAFRAQISQVDTSQLPSDKRFNPLAGHPFPAFQALKQSDRWTAAELVRGMDLLLEANVQLVASGLEEAVVLQRALIEIIGTTKPNKNS